MLFFIFKFFVGDFIMISIDLKLKAKLRIIEDVVQNIVREQPVKGAVLILDVKTSQMISQYTKMEELVTNGVVLLENIERVRKVY